MTASPLKLILEELFFSPVPFLILLLILAGSSWRRSGWTLQSKTLLAVWMVLLLSTSSWFFQWFAFPLKWLTPESVHKQADAIVVASAGVHPSGAPTPSSTLRAYTAGRLYLEGLAPLVIVTGGVTEPYAPPVSIKGIHIILRGMGVKDEDIVIENRSADTYGNGVETVKIIAERNLKRILLVSHDYHLFRLSSVFEKLEEEQQLEVAHYSFAANQQDTARIVPWWQIFDWENFGRLQTIAHEYIGLLTYKATGRI